ncbi:chorismate mutase [Rhizobium sp. NFR07]|uniref:chorismate mutase n=1 Tax=Rhizobium sp. NFR07 TaxID=1566262 RepID=UPI0008E0D8D5|nr:chorismate mutase [Rhizobium sp. NFR07]SFB31181.1 chorismate mutase [Rhizobium sp. NFR07]
MTNSDPKTMLSHYRQSIDNLDAALINILAERFRCTERVGFLKARYGLAPRDEERERLQLERVRGIAANAGLDEDFAQDFLSLLLREVVKNHAAIAHDYNGDKAAAS